MSSCGVVLSEVFPYRCVSFCVVVFYVLVCRSDLVNKNRRTLVDEPVCTRLAVAVLPMSKILGFVYYNGIVNIFNIPFQSANEQWRVLTSSVNGFCPFLPLRWFLVRRCSEMRSGMTRPLRMSIH